MKDNRNIIEIENISKIFNFQDNKGLTKSFYALKDITFSVKSGEVFGVIGSNGSGKSTLLKILSGITNPSSGRILLKSNSISAILNISAGFHPELNGRENVYLRGKLLGMSRNEIDSVYSEIVDFSEIGDFIETPVKHYSDGMFLRLAFSIMMHIKTDILLLDEVLSVGDAQFMTKCRARIADLKKDKTIIIISHDMNSILNLCDRVLWLNRGEVMQVGEKRSVVESYLRHSGASLMGLHTKTEHEFTESEQNRFDFIKFKYIKCYGENGNSTSFKINECITLSLTFSVLQIKQNIDILFELKNSLGQNVFSLSPTLWSDQKIIPNLGDFTLNGFIPPYLLPIGSYSLSVGINIDGSLQPYVLEVIQIQIDQHREINKNNIWFISGNSILGPILNWELKDKSTTVQINKS